MIAAHRSTTSQAHTVMSNGTKTCSLSSPPWDPSEVQLRQRQSVPRRRPPACSATAAAARSGSSMRVLPDGTALEFVREQPRSGGGQPPLLFLHGSGHAAWCWQERFLPFFAERGYDSYALSFRGQGGSAVSAGTSPLTLSDNAADVAEFIRRMPETPVVIAHSFGGLALQKYVEQQAAKGWPEVPGTAYLASAPPNGNQKLVKRIVKAMPLKSIAITWGFITKSYTRSPAAAKSLFLSEDIPDDDAKRIGELFKANPVAVGLVDTRKLKEELPIEFPNQRPPAYVAGGDTDCIVDVVAVQELAAALDVEPVIHRNMAHDLMLDTRWQEAAESLEAWLQTL